VKGRFQQVESRGAPRILAQHEQRKPSSKMGAKLKSVFQFSRHGKTRQDPAESPPPISHIFNDIQLVLPIPWLVLQGAGKRSSTYVIFISINLFRVAYQEYKM
jgi:hypothetical protein